MAPLISWYVLISLTYLQMKHTVGSEEFALTERATKARAVKTIVQVWWSIALTSSSFCRQKKEKLSKDMQIERILQREILQRVLFCHWSEKFMNCFQIGSCYSVRRGARVLRHHAGRHRGLLLRGLQRPQARERRAPHGRQTGMLINAMMNWVRNSH